jgi:2-oxoglutarate/2-oxoacid ferredoxin oxidoreductase subunit alpha
MTKIIENITEATIRFAGDSGDGMQLIGTQFSDTSGFAGNEVNTFPDYPSEIRAPEGTLYGVSAFQIHFGAEHIYTSGDNIDVLVAMNASSLKVNLPNVRTGGIIIANEEGFDSRNLTLAKFPSNPLKDGTLAAYELHVLNFSSELKSLSGQLAIPGKVLDKVKNIFALGITYWLFDRPLEPTITWINKKFATKADLAYANVHALKAGFDYAAMAIEFRKQFRIGRSPLPSGRYRSITGNEAIALGLVVASRKAHLPLFLGSYPITPATDILHAISGYKKYGVKHLQAEDEIAGICSAIGAAYGGSLAATTTSGPGLSLKTEALGLAVMTELPLIVVDVQRAGPSTGLPTKPEQSDLLLAMFGRHGEAPMPVLAAASPSDCFQLTLEAARIALKYMTPVMLLSDGYIGQASEPWRIPSAESLPEIRAFFATQRDSYAPYKRDAETLRRLWAIPGFEGMEHRIGGLEKEDGSGNVSHDPKNHEKMVRLRQEKIDRMAFDIPQLLVEGEQNGDVLILCWGSTYGAAKTAFETLRAKGIKCSFARLQYLNPFPANMLEVLSRFDRVVVPELNSGQLKLLLQAKYLKPIEGVHKVQGKPFTALELQEKIERIITERI